MQFGLADKFVMLVDSNYKEELVILWLEERIVYLLALLFLLLMREDLGIFKRCWKIWVKEEVERTFIIQQGDHCSQKSGDWVQIPTPSPLT